MKIGFAGEENRNAGLRHIPQLCGCSVGSAERQHWVETGGGLGTAAAGTGFEPRRSCLSGRAPPLTRRGEPPPRLAIGSLAFTALVLPIHFPLSNSSPLLSASINVVGFVDGALSLKSDQKGLLTSKQ